MDTLVGFSNKFDATTFRKYLDEAQTQLHGSQPLFVFNNHDNVRSLDRYGDGVHNQEIAKVLATVLLTTRATALLFEGEELGMVTTTPTRLADVRDPVGITGWPKEKGRDGGRTPMQWDDSANAGFTTANATPWLPVPPSYKAINVKSEESDSNSMLNWYKQLIKLRGTNAALRDGKNIMLNTSDPDVLSWARQVPGHPAVVVTCNFTNQSQKISLEVSEQRIAGRQVRTLLKTPGGVDPSSLNAVELLPFGVYIGLVE
jgi:alpha-glucosidase